MKAILVIDMPNKCESCPCSTINDEIDGSMVFTCDALPNKEITEGNMTKRKPSWCPLRPLPSFKTVDLNDTRDVMMFCHGWNACLEEIIGETE